LARNLATPFALAASPKLGLRHCKSENNTPILEIPLRESIEPSFMETLISFARTQVEGASQKITSKGKGKLKEKVIEPPSSNAFVGVPLSQTL